MTLNMLTVGLWIVADTPGIVLFYFMVHFINHNRRPACQTPFPAVELIRGYRMHYCMLILSYSILRSALKWYSTGGRCIALRMPFLYFFIYSMGVNHVLRVLVYCYPSINNLTLLYNKKSSLFHV